MASAEWSEVLGPPPRASGAAEDPQTICTALGVCQVLEWLGLKKPAQAAAPQDPFLSVGSDAPATAKDTEDLRRGLKALGRARPAEAPVGSAELEKPQESEPEPELAAMQSEVHATESGSASASGQCPRGSLLEATEFHTFAAQAAANSAADVPVPPDDDAPAEAAAADAPAGWAQTAAAADVAVGRPATHGSHQREKSAESSIGPPASIESSVAPSLAEGDLVGS